MRKILLNVAVTLDGYIAGPNGEYDWCFTDQDYGLPEFFKRVDTAFLGRKTYELTQTMNSDDESGLPDLKQYIFSTTLEKVKDGETLIRDNVQSIVESIKNEAGKDIWLFGGAELTTTLINLMLVDELILSVHPILLGKGIALFQNIKNRIKLSLTDSHPYSSGLVTLSYKINYA